MALSNRERIDKGLNDLREGLTPFAEREFEAHLGDNWLAQVNQTLRFPRTKDHGVVDWDNDSLLRAMWDQWNVVFRNALGQVERNYISELRDVRNRHAHEVKFSYDDTERALDTASRLLKTVGAVEQSEEIQKSRKEVILTQQREEARNQTRKAIALSGEPTAGLKPWREVIAPHPDVASGGYQQAEFAADLAKVHNGTAADEYLDSHSFFSRTFITTGLHELLTIGIKRLTGSGGDPVLELKTNFGGGKTHSMVALYHLFGGGEAANLPGLDKVLAEVETYKLPKANRAVLVGTSLAAAQTRTKADGTEINTMWGEMAFQLGGAEGFKMVAESDKEGINPGSEVLEELLARFSPCLILIDEWIAFLRNLPGKNHLKSGSYDSNLSFAHSLTEAVKAVPSALVVASLPMSEIEIGGDNGKKALDSLANTFKRVAKPWQPASTDEGFEIVKRRLFNIEGTQQAQVDAVVNAFSDMYTSQSSEFPSACKEQEYKRRLKACYPIHPELFDQLNESWSTLEMFQRTRGVLRLMAAVIHELWERDDRSLMILPASITLDAGPVRSLVTECLTEKSQWDGVLSKDIDGDNSLSKEIDQNLTNLGRYSAARRVARSIFMGAAPTVTTGTPGIEDNQIRLSCTQPGESVATFGDALRRMTDRATYLNSDKGRYWFSLQATVSNLARDRAEGLRGRPEVADEIIERLSKERNAKDLFAAVHVAPADSSEIADEIDARLVILGPDVAHKKKDDESSARKLAIEILEKRGTSTRSYRNALVFLVPDQRRLEELESAICQHLAWKSIQKDGEDQSLVLTNFAINQAKTKVEESNKICQARIRETWSIAMVPFQPEPMKSDIAWEDHSVSGDGHLAERVAKKLKTAEAIFDSLGAPRLKMELDRYLWNEAEKNHVDVRYIRECFATFLYMPRLTKENVLIQAIEGAFTGSLFCEQFAYANGFDTTSNRYTGLQTTTLNTSITLDGSSVLVKPEPANLQEESDKATAVARAGTANPSSSGTTVTPLVEEDSTGGSGIVTNPGDSPSAQTLPKNFFARLQLSPTGAGLKFNEAMEEVFQHFSSKVNCDIKINIEFEANDADGFDESLQRTVKENSKTLGFDQAEFEE